MTRSSGNRNCSALLCCIDIPSYYYNKSQARLLFCYSNGHVNIVNPKELLELKLHRPGVKSNGFSPKAPLTRIFICNKTDWLAICCRTAPGQEYLHLFPLAERTVHKTMSAAGNQFVKDAHPYRWQVIPGQIMNQLTRRRTAFTLPATGEYFTAFTELMGTLAAEGTHALCPDLY